MAANIPKLHATKSQASGSLPRQDTGQVQNSSSPGTSSWTSWKLRLRSAKIGANRRQQPPWLQKNQLHVKEKTQSQAIRICHAKIQVRLSPCPKQ
ncbi:hypothetical protein KY284_035080 [Solanum tuberosum]|nr:hypothetical protein KY284_035080 [Solanum tuberosum]